MTENEMPDRTVRMEVPADDADVTQVIASQPEEARTVELVAETVTEAASQTTLFRTHFFKLKKRKDVNSVMEQLQEKRQHGEIRFSGNEDSLELLENTYNLEKQFAEGGQGLLYHGFDRKLERLVAIKSLRPEMTEDAHQRNLFLNEARVTAQLDHPAIVPIYTLNSDAGNGLHLAMKLIRGETLKSYLEQVRTHYRLDGVKTYDESNALRYRLDIFLKACDALEYAHTRNVMHCDLKPANIMIGEYREAYIMDWGIARRIRETEPEADDAEKQPVCGTPQYLAPETIRGEQGDQRADIFAMGAILFELVMLKTAFSGETVAALMNNIRKGQMDPMEHRFHARVDGDLKAIIAKAAAHDPAARYREIGELATDLRHYLAGREVSARPDNPVMKTVRWFSLHRRLTVTLMLVAMLIGVGGLAFSLYREYRFSEQQRLRDFALSAAYAFGAEGAYLLDKQFSKMELMTELIAADVQYLLRYDPHEINMAEPSASLLIPELKKQPSPGMIDSTFHRGRIDPAAVAYNMTADTESATVGARLDVLARFIPRLLQTILESPVEARMTDENLAALKAAAFTEGTPVIRVLFGFPDGLYVAYPASGDFPEHYDPRSRMWYPPEGSWKAHDTIWSRPYIDSIPEIGLVISCSVPMQVPGMRGSGVCAVDISLAELIEELHSSGNSGDCVLEKAIVDDSGKIIVSTTRSFADTQLRHFSSADEEVNFADLDNPALWRVVNERKFGIQTGKDASGVDVVYVFFHIASVNWFYVEKLDMARLSQTFRPAI